MSESIDQQLIGLKGFTFDGDTGRTLEDLYQEVSTKGYIKDSPFIMPLFLKGARRPSVVNSFLDPEGKRVHIVWNSDDSGASHVVDVIPNAPSLVKESTGDSCDTCNCGCGIPPNFDEED